MAGSAIEIHHINAAVVASGHTERQSVRVVLVLWFINHTKCRVSATGFAVGQVLGEYLGKRNPDPVGDAIHLLPSG